MEHIKEPHKPSCITEDEFFRRAQIPTAPLEVPELGEGVVIKIKALSLEDRSKMQSACRMGSGTVNEDGVKVYDIDNTLFTVLTLVHGVVEPVISVRRVDELKKANPIVVRKIAEAICELSGIETQKKAGDSKNASKGT